MASTSNVTDVAFDVPLESVTVSVIVWLPLPPELMAVGRLTGTFAPAVTVTVPRLVVAGAVAADVLVHTAVTVPVPPVTAPVTLMSVLAPNLSPGVGEKIAGTGPLGASPTSTVTDALPVSMNLSVAVAVSVCVEPAVPG